MLLHCYLSKNKRVKRQCDPRSPVPIPIHCQDEQLSYPLAIPHRYPKPFPSPIPISIPTEPRQRTTSALLAAISRPALYLIDAAQRSSPPPTAALIPAAHGGTAPHRTAPPVPAGTGAPRGAAHACERAVPAPAVPRCCQQGALFGSSAPSGRSESRAPRARNAACCKGERKAAMNAPAAQ